MRAYRRDELTRFLQSLDERIAESRTLVVIGGAAAALAYGIARATIDIDTITDISDLEAALERARDDTGLDVPLQTVGVHDAPYCFEDRLVLLELGLSKLRIVVPEKHDLALMKVVRGQDNDREAIQQIAERVGLDERTLVDRFKHEMTHAIGSRRLLRANFLAVIEMLYGESAADRISSELRGPDGIDEPL